ncbi:MAG: hypothetical protein AAGF95_11030 [Chloroflexota bacterium]
MKKIFSVISMIAIAFTLSFGSAAAAPATQSFCSTNTFSSTSNNEVSVTASAEGCEGSVLLIVTINGETTTQAGSTLTVTKVVDGDYSYEAIVQIDSTAVSQSSGSGSTGGSPFPFPWPWNF